MFFDNFFRHNNRYSSFFLIAFASCLAVHCKSKPGHPIFGGIIEASKDSSQSGKSGDSNPLKFPNESETSDVVPVDLTGHNEVFADIVSTIRRGSCSPDSKGKASTRIITRSEWIKTVNEVLKINLEERSFSPNLPPSSAPPTNAPFSDYDHLRDYNTMSVERLQKYLTANKIVADKVVSEQGDTILKCGSGSAKACVLKWLGEKLPSLWKISPQPAELTAQGDFFDKAGGDKPAFGRLLERVLLSPYFLYRSNLGLSGQLTSWEVASTLADALWDSPVTGDLAKTASADGLKTTADIEAQVAKMIADPKFYRGVQRFVKSWLQSAHIASKAFKTEQNISDAAKVELVNESTNYLFYLIRNQQDSVSSIFTSKFTIGSQAMALAYNFPIEASIPESLGMGKDLKRLTLTDGRQGLLSQPGLITGISSLEKTNIPRRGQEIMAQFMCQGLATPDNLADTVKSIGMTNDPNESEVAFFNKVGKSSPVCSKCHEFINGVGFGLEEVGSTGKFRTLDDHMKPIVSEGALIGIEGHKVKYQGVIGLNAAMSKSVDFKACMTVQLFRSIHGRIETKQDSCTIANALKKASTKTLSFTSIFSALLTDKSFLNRKKAGE